MNSFRSGLPCETGFLSKETRDNSVVVIIGVEILVNNANGFPPSVNTVRRNDMELVYKFSVKTGFFFAVCSFCWQRMDAQFIAGKLICDHIISHLDEKIHKIKSLCWRNLCRGTAS